MMTDLGSPSRTLTGNGSHHNPLIEEKLAERTSYQSKWKLICSWTYFASTILTISAATVATILGAAGVALGAAIAAGVATLLTATEKGLRFQDRWRHHRATEYRYEKLQVNYALGYIDDHQAIDEMTRIGESYDEKFPFGDLQLTT
jgi:hypothetical protein